MSNRGFLHINSLIMFLTEAVSFVVQYNNLRWEPPVAEHNPTPVLFHRSIGEASTHHCMVELFSRYEPEWTLLSSLEAAAYIQNYLKALMDAIPNRSYHTYLCFISFISHLCAQTIRHERTEIVPYIIVEAADILISRCGSYRDIAKLFQAAFDYNHQHSKTCSKK
ncbi:uncharacterized protein TNIN_106491 [Trichonephila inaurata madagascariensis]|uniref:Uncharacterized protein n=1 Tax=Trichonephila inaurata madagascariensis TaxID=2747483 RepID=A0A8X7C102_9ARAC|nr:uncharacterized protein TNIN_106491 [Trichonephila inaurata madagascariensis]